MRDALAGRAVADIDLATPEPPEIVIEALSRAGLKHAPTGLEHGTVTAISGGRGFEVTTLRTDARTDGRHAEVVWTADWVADAARRDFTINAMSMRRDGAVFDYFGGVADLREGRVRFVGEPGQRIAEDYLRVLRFFRFQARFGVAAPDAETAAALRAAVPGLARLSVERVWSELKRILAIPDPVAAVWAMAEYGILGAVLGVRVDLAGFERLVRSGAPAEALLRLAALVPVAGGLAARLRLSRAEAEALASLAGAAPDPGWSDDAMRRAFVDVPGEAWVGRAWLAGGDDPVWAGLRTRLEAMKRPVFPLQGRDVTALGVQPGPAVGVLLGQVRAWWREGGCVADAEACRAQLAALAGR